MRTWSARHGCTLEVLAARGAGQLTAREFKALRMHELFLRGELAGNVVVKLSEIRAGG